MCDGVIRSNNESDTLRNISQSNKTHNHNCKCRHDFPSDISRQHISLSSSPAWLIKRTRLWDEINSSSMLFMSTLQNVQTTLNNFIRHKRVFNYLVPGDDKWLCTVYNWPIKPWWIYLVRAFTNKTLLKR